MVKLLGYKKGVSKQNKPYCIAYVVEDLSAREKERGSVGSKVEDLFLPVELVDVLRPVDVGKELVLDWSVSGGRAFLAGLTVK